MTTRPHLPRRWLRAALALLPLALALLVALGGAGRLGWLAGTAPGDLGVLDGRLKPPSDTPNSVSSQAHLYPEHPMHEQAQIAPLRVAGGGPASIERIAGVVTTMPGARIVEQRPNYLYARFSSRWLGFVDDVEFWADGEQVQVRSASRLGSGDLGVNRARIEAIRQQLRATL